MVICSLKMYSNKEQVRRHKVHDKKEDHATAEFGMDAQTRIYLYKMINAQLLERVNGVISIGKHYNWLCLLVYYLKTQS